MSSLKYIVMAQVSVQPEHLQEVIALSAKTLKLTLEEPGCEAFYQTCKTDDPHTLVFFEVFTSRKLSICIWLLITPEHFSTV